MLRLWGRNWTSKNVVFVVGFLQERETSLINMDIIKNELSNIIWVEVPWGHIRIGHINQIIYWVLSHKRLCLLNTEFLWSIALIHLFLSTLLSCYIIAILITIILLPNPNFQILFSNLQLIVYRFFPTFLKSATLVQFIILL